MILLAGCSFLYNSHLPSIIAGKNPCDVIAKGSAGNEFISKSVVYNIKKSDYKKVFILWTGLIRLDLEVSLQYDLSAVDSYRKTIRDDRAWFHSGGLNGGCLNDHSVPKWIREHFRQQYLPLDHDLIQSQSLYHIACCLNTLESNGIDYKFGFIYDIHRPNEQPSLGPAVPRHHPMVKTIPWKNYIPINPYEYCLENGLLDSDNFHPTPEGYQKWWDATGIKL